MFLSIVLGMYCFRHLGKCQYVLMRMYERSATEVFVTNI